MTHRLLVQLARNRGSGHHRAGPHQFRSGRVVKSTRTAGRAVVVETASPERAPGHTCADGRRTDVMGARNRSRRPFHQKTLDMTPILATLRSFRGLSQRKRLDELKRRQPTVFWAATHRGNLGFGIRREPACREKDRSRLDTILIHRAHTRCGPVPTPMQTGSMWISSP